VYANEYTQIRRALKKDIRSLIALTKNSVATTELLRRTRSAIEKQLQDYYLFEIDRNPVGCVALHSYPDQKKGELAFLFVSPSHENQGIGFKLMQFVEAKAREQGLTELFTLSTQAFNFFKQKGGYREGSSEDLPPERRDRYNASGRNSKVLVKTLEPQVHSLNPRSLPAMAF
jgi:amino-acid N-acetyltransferase